MRQMLGPGALGRPRGIGWRGRWEGGLGCGIHVTPWLIHVNVWQNPLQCCEVISLQLIKINEKKKKERKKNSPVEFVSVSIPEGLLQAEPGKPEWCWFGNRVNSLFSKGCFWCNYTNRGANLSHLILKQTLSGTVCLMMPGLPGGHMTKHFHPGGGSFWKRWEFCQ